MRKKIYVLSSTHWDREWYQPFETYRARLVRMIDNLLELLETNEDYRYFHFDGQTIFIEDYLSIRPQNRERLYRQIRQGRILIGPWYTMPDEFLISGEALVRNLQNGRRICEELQVDASDNGYVCDIFGHNSQLPQILRGFQLDTMSFFRGQSGYGKDNFIWKGADGSTVIAHKLHPDYNYASFFYATRWQFDGGVLDKDAIVRRMKRYLEEECHNFTECPHLMIDGLDHIDAEKQLPEILQLLNEKIDGYEFIHSNMADYNEEVRENAANLETVTGVMYDVAAEGVTNALLKNVLSSTVHIKQANDYCESTLSLKTEVLNYWFHSVQKAISSDYVSMAPYEDFIDKAWDFVLKNQSHDSICGCSITAVHLDNENGFKHAEEIIETVENDICRCLSKNISSKSGRDGALVILNNTQQHIDGVTEVVFEIEKYRHHGEFKFYSEDGKDVLFHIVSHEKYVKKGHNFGKVISFADYDRYTLTMDLKIAPFSYVTVGYDALKQERDYKDGKLKFDLYEQPTRYLGSMRTGLNTVDNGPLLVTINSNGTLDILDKDSGKLYQGMLAMEDCGDTGEGWNYVKPPFDEEIISTCCDAQVMVLCDFLDYFSFKIILHVKVPCCAEGETRSRQNTLCEIESTIKVFKDSKKISIVTNVDNRQVNHRLRVVFPTYFKTKKFKTLIPFDVYEWDVEKKDWSCTKEIDTLVNPNQGMVSITDEQSMFSLYNKGLYEVSVPDRTDRAVYLTLFRSATQEFGQVDAGIIKMQRKITAEYMLDFERHTDNELVKNSNAFKTGIVCFEAETGKKSLPAIGRFLKISGGAVLSSLRVNRTIDGETYHIIRIYDAGDGCEGEIKFNSEISQVFETTLSEDKLMDAVHFFSHSFTYKLKPKQIRTFAFK